MGIAQRIPTSFYSWSGTADPWLSWILNVASLAVPPHVIAISYGSDEKSISTSYFHSFKIQALKLAAKGVTILASTGDFGANGDSCGYVVQFPSSVPYVTAVGGSQGPEKGKRYHLIGCVLTRFMSVYLLLQGPLKLPALLVLDV